MACVHFVFSLSVFFVVFSHEFSTSMQKTRGHNIQCIYLLQQIFVANDILCGFFLISEFLQDFFLFCSHDIFATFFLLFD